MSTSNPYKPTGITLFVYEVMASLMFFIYKKKFNFLRITANHFWCNIISLVPHLFNKTSAFMAAADACTIASAMFMGSSTAPAKSIPSRGVSFFAS